MEHLNLPQIDAALDAARALRANPDAPPYAPEIEALLRAAESMRNQLFGSYRDDADPQPVFVLRARDRQALDAIRSYARACEAAGLDEQAWAVGQAIDEFEAWRRRNTGALQSPNHPHVPAV